MNANPLYLYSLPAVLIISYTGLMARVQDTLSTNDHKIFVVDRLDRKRIVKMRPYSCLGDISHHWPSDSPSIRRGDEKAGGRRSVPGKRTAAVKTVRKGKKTRQVGRKRGCKGRMVHGWQVEMGSVD